MFTDDIRLERIEGEYQNVRGTQDKLMDRMNGFGDAMQHLTDQVAANAILIEANRRAIEENRRAIEENRKAIEEIREEILLLRQAVAENSRMLADIIEHLQVPRRRAGFVGED